MLRIRVRPRTQACLHGAARRVDPHEEEPDMSAVKRTLLVAALLCGATVAAAPQAQAGPFRLARRTAARVVLPPYPLARRAVFGPVYRPYRPFYGGYGPGFYRPGISVGVGVY